MGHLISRDDLRDVSQTVSIVAAGLDSRREMTSLGAQVRQELKQLRAGLSSTPVALPLQTAGRRAAGQGVGEWGRVRTGARPRHGPQFGRNGTTSGAGDGASVECAVVVRLYKRDRSHRIAGSSSSSTVHSPQRGPRKGSAARGFARPQSRVASYLSLRQAIDCARLTGVALRLAEQVVVLLVTPDPR